MRKITATELSRRLSDVLSRVRYQRERFVVERNGEPVAALEPVTSTFTVRDMLGLLASLPVPDEDFASDVEEMRPGPPRVPEWPI